MPGSGPAGWLSMRLQRLPTPRHPWLVSGLQRSERYHRHPVVGLVAGSERGQHDEARRIPPPGGVHSRTEGSKGVDGLLDRRPPSELDLDGSPSAVEAVDGGICLQVVPVPVAVEACPRTTARRPGGRARPSTRTTAPSFPRSRSTTGGEAARAATASAGSVKYRLGVFRKRTDDLTWVD